MAKPVFYCEEVPGPGQRIELDATESRHATGARRLRPGDPVRIFNGTGTLADAVIRSLDQDAHTVTLEVRSQWWEPQPAPRVHLAAAMPKGDRQRVLLDMATQLGMASFTPLICEWSVVKPVRSMQARWRRICIQACKQSQRGYLPELRQPQTPYQFAHDMQGHRTLITQRDGEPLAHQLIATDELALLVGPEGGFTGSELESVLSLGARAVSLGANILRIETAAVAGLSCVMAITPSSAIAK